MAKQGPASYKVTLTAVRNYVLGSDAPKKSQFWDFVQTVAASGGYPGALSAMAELFFKTYPKPNGEGIEGDFVIILPDGKRGQLVITRNDRSRLRAYLSGKEAVNQGDYMLRSEDATLGIQKLRAMSGDTPTSLTPKSDKELSDRIHKNTESVQWWQDSIVQMPAPIYVLDKAAAADSSAPRAIRYRGCTYQRVAAVPLERLPLPQAKLLFSDFMENVTRMLSNLADLAMTADMQVQEGSGKKSTSDILTEAATVALKDLTPALIDVRNIAARIEKMERGDHA